MFAWRASEGICLTNKQNPVEARLKAKRQRRQARVVENAATNRPTQRERTEVDKLECVAPRGERGFHRSGRRLTERSAQREVRLWGVGRAASEGGGDIRGLGTRVAQRSDRRDVGAESFA